MSLCMSSWFDVLLHEDAYCWPMLAVGTGIKKQFQIVNFWLVRLKAYQDLLSALAWFSANFKKNKKNKKTTLLSNSLPDSYLSHVQVFFSYWLCSDFEKIKQVHQHRNLPPCLAVVSVSVCVLTDDVNATVSVCEISLQAYTWEVRSCQSKYKI